MSMNVIFGYINEISQLQNTEHTELAIPESCNRGQNMEQMWQLHWWLKGKGKGSPYSTTERRVPELIPVLGSQPAGDVSHKPGGRLPLLSAKPAVTHTTLKRAATNFAGWWTKAQWVWAVCLRLLPDSVATAIWTLMITTAKRKPFADTDQFLLTKQVRCFLKTPCRAKANVSPPGCVTGHWRNENQFRG